MRRHGLVLLCTLGLAALAAAVAATIARAHTTPQIQREQQHARSVLAEVGRIGDSLQKVQDQAWNAKQKLVEVKRSLHQNEYRLRLARGNLHTAQQRIMSRLYSLYVNGAPSTVDVIAGAHSISQVIDRAESAEVLSNQDAALGQQAVRFEHAVQQRERQLRQLERQRENTLNDLLAKKRTVQSELVRQKRLLASIHTTIHQLQAQERARELRLKAAAERRLKEAEAAAKRKAQEEQAAQAQQAQSGSAASSPPTASSPPSPPVNVPTGSPGVGHPQAASIALNYLGVPYKWGGASPSGFDCSGLVMYVYAQLGISLPHYTVAQWNATEPISQSQMQPGDLVFFDGLGHVGIYIGSGEFVDAPHSGSVVRIDHISGFGSFDGARRVP
jgi:cell wall-associated NlpC family hydrolase